MSINEKHFSRFDFSRDQIEKNLSSAFRDLEIAKKTDIYSGGIEVTEKECEECLNFTENVLKRLKKFIYKK